MGTSFSAPVISGGEYLTGWNKPRPPGSRTFFLNAGHGASFGYQSGIAPGSDSNDGLSWDTPFLTLAHFLANVRTFDRLFFVGDVREEALIGSNLAFDVQIIGCGGRHHPDNPDSTAGAYHRGGSMIRPPASPTAATDLITVRGRGWEFYNVHFDCPVDAAAVVLITNASSGTDEYDGSHAGFYGCSFQQGKFGIKESGGIINVQIDDCDFRIMSVTGGAAIVSVAGAGVRTPQYWNIRNSRFSGNAASGGNVSHIIMHGLNGSTIKDNVFGTVTSTALYIDLASGAGNIVTRNLLAGNYDTTDYVAGTSDLWGGNMSANPSSKATVGDNGWTITVPGA